MSYERKTDSPKPTLSVILAVLNEGRYLRSVVQSLLKQQTELGDSQFNLEILVVDGMSTDNSREIVSEMASADPRVRLISNERRKTPYAFNLGIREARGEYVAILGSHTYYQPDYLAVCLSELSTHNAVGCSGRILSEPADNSFPARMAAWVSGHRFGTSGSSFRTTPEGYADSIGYPVFLRQPLLDVGGYDETLHRNQDNDMNERLRRAGHRLYCTWKTHSVYHTQPTLRALMKYALKNGYWNIISLRKNAASMSLRHYIPLLFVVAIFTSLMLAGAGLILLPDTLKFLAWLPLILVLGSYFFCAFLASLDLALKQRTLGPLLLPPAFLAFHVSYGLGSIQAILNRGREPVEG